MPVTSDNPLLGNRECVRVCDKVRDNPLLGDRECVRERPRVIA